MSGFIITACFHFIHSGGNGEKFKAKAKMIFVVTLKENVIMMSTRLDIVLEMFPIFTFHLEES